MFLVHLEVYGSQPCHHIDLSLLKFVLITSQEAGRELKNLTLNDLLFQWTWESGWPGSCGKCRHTELFCSFYLLYISGLALYQKLESMVKFSTEECTKTLRQGLLFSDIKPWLI